MRFLSAEDLIARGIKFSRQHRHRLIKEGKFPRPVKLGANTNAWPEPEIDAYQENCIAKRDAAAPTLSPKGKSAAWGARPAPVQQGLRRPPRVMKEQLRRGEGSTPSGLTLTVSEAGRPQSANPKDKV
jgi:prophage regulatory protein